MLKSPLMRITSLLGSVEGLRRKLRGLAAMVEDHGAMEHEKANAEALKARLEQQLREAGFACGRLDGQPLSARQTRCADETSEPIGYAGSNATFFGSPRGAVRESLFTMADAAHDAKRQSWLARMRDYDRGLV